MIHDAGVKQVAFGGRPQPGKIQGMGGVKGGESLGWDSVYAEAQFMIEYGNITAEQVAILSNLTTLPFERATATSLNFRDIILPDEVAQAVPAQFITEESDCRLYWTPEMITDVTKVWEAAANSAFNGAPCAFGGISKPKNKRSELSASAKAKKSAEAKRVAEARKLKNRSMQKRAVQQQIPAGKHGRRVIE